MNKKTFECILGRHVFDESWTSTCLYVSSAPECQLTFCSGCRKKVKVSYLYSLMSGSYDDCSTWDVVKEYPGKVVCRRLFGVWCTNTFSKRKRIE